MKRVILRGEFVPNLAVLSLSLLLFSGLTRGDSVRVSELGYCPVVSIADSVLGFQDSFCSFHNSYDVAVIEGGEGILQKALNSVYSHKQDYVAVLFYASWCPFSRNFRPSFSALSALYPSIPHLTIEESAVKPSILSKYGVHGFPTIFILNATMRVRYRGSRTLSSLVHFYSDVTGLEGDPRDKFQLNKIETTLNQEKNTEEETNDYPFSWARSPKNFLQQETYLALATIFILLKLAYFLFPYLLELSRHIWRRYMQHIRVTMLWEHPLRFLNKTKQVLSSFWGPHKGSNLQEGAINARAWASKSLASAVSATSSASH